MVRVAVAQFCSVRRALALLLAVLIMATALSVVTGSPADATPSVDKRLSQGECALTGRVCIPAAAAPGTTASRARPCSRRATTPSSAGWRPRRRRVRPPDQLPPLQGPRPDLDRRDQLLRLQPQPGALRHTERPAVPWQRQDLRQPRRGGGALRRVPHPGPGREVEQIAKRKKQSLNEAALDRNRFNCSYRAGWVMQNGTCVKREGPVPASQQGGFYMVGDSVSWRADDELAERQGNWVLDLRPGRRLDELPGRLDWFRANHGDPDQVIIQLGTNRRRGFNEDDFRTTILSIPATTPVLFLLPYRKFTGDNAGPVAATKKYARGCDASPRPPADLPLGLAEDRRVPPRLPGRRRAPRRPARGLVRQVRRPSLEGLRPPPRAVGVGRVWTPAARGAGSGGPGAVSGLRRRVAGSAFQRGCVALPAPRPSRLMPRGRHPRSHPAHRPRFVDQLWVGGGLVSAARFLARESSLVEGGGSAPVETR